MRDRFTKYKSKTKWQFWQTSRTNSEIVFRYSEKKFWCLLNHSKNITSCSSRSVHNTKWAGKKNSPGSAFLFTRTSIPGLLIMLKICRTHWVVNNQWTNLKRVILPLVYGKTPPLIANYCTHVSHCLCPSPSLFALSFYCKSDNILIYIRIYRTN